jgi:hypothetical protein
MKASSPGPAKPFSIAASALAAALIIFAGLFATGAGILLAHMPQAFEVAGKVFDLPAFLAADLGQRRGIGSLPVAAQSKSGLQESPRSGLKIIVLHGKLFS